MNNERQLKLIDYILGYITAKDDSELAKILQSENIETEIAEITESLNLMNTNITPIKPSNRLKDSIFATINKSTDAYLMGFSKRLSAFFDLPITRIEQLLKKVKKPFAAPWESTFIEGAHFLHFDGGEKFKGAHCGIIHLEKGTSIRKHLHIGDELMFVLDGTVTADNGKQYSPGDILLSKDKSTHALKGNHDSECVFAVITMQDVQFL